MRAKKNQGKQDRLRGRLDQAILRRAVRHRGAKIRSNEGRIAIGIASEKVKPGSSGAFALTCPYRSMT
jgi:hypothetical protein